MNVLLPQGQATLHSSVPSALLSHPSPSLCFPAGAQGCGSNGLDAGPLPRWGRGPGGVADLGHCSRALSHEKRLLLLTRAARVPPGCLGSRWGQCWGSAATCPATMPPTNSVAHRGALARDMVPSVNSTAPPAGCSSGGPTVLSRVPNTHTQIKKKQQRAHKARKEAVSQKVLKKRRGAER